MAENRSPINSSVLAWAVSEDGRAPSEIARAAKVSAASFEAWVSGEALPTVGETTQLASALKRPRALFFLPEAPTRSALPSGFRHPPGGGDRTVGPNTLLEARRAKRIQQAIAWASSDEPIDIPSARLSDSPEDASTRAREWLARPAVERWSNDYEALRSRRESLEGKGVLVFALRLGRDEVRGFANWDPVAPLIVMNTQGVTPAARSFTLGHELGHLFLREATACLEPRGRVAIDSRTERWCERFAATLLMPTQLTLEFLESLHVEKGAAGVSTVGELMKAFRVSARSVALRLEDLGFAEPRLYAHVQAVFKPKTSSRQEDVRSPARPVKRLREYGERTISRVIESLPENEALSVLRMTVADARALAEDIPSARHV